MRGRAVMMLPTLMLTGVSLIIIINNNVLIDSSSLTKLFKQILTFVESLLLPRILPTDTCSHYPCCGDFFFYSIPPIFQYLGPASAMI